jgi:hypothetical protein
MGNVSADSAVSMTTGSSVANPPAAATSASRHRVAPWPTAAFKAPRTTINQQNTMLSRDKTSRQSGVLCSQSEGRDARGPTSRTAPNTSAGNLKIMFGVGLVVDKAEFWVPKCTEHLAGREHHKCDRLCLLRSGCWIGRAFNRSSSSLAPW